MLRQGHGREISPLYQFRQPQNTCHNIGLPYSRTTRMCRRCCLAQGLMSIDHLPCCTIAYRQSINAAIFTRLSSYRSFLYTIRALNRAIGHIEVADTIGSAFLLTCSIVICRLRRCNETSEGQKADDIHCRRIDNVNFS